MGGGARSFERARSCTLLSLVAVIMALCFAFMPSYAIAEETASIDSDKLYPTVIVDESIAHGEDAVGQPVESVEPEPTLVHAEPLGLEEDKAASALELEGTESTAIEALVTEPTVEPSEQEPIAEMAIENQDDETAIAPVEQPEGAESQMEDQTVLTTCTSISFDPDGEQTSERHAAYIYYSASSGGSIAPGESTKPTGNIDGITEFFSNSEWGTAMGATAIASEGYSFSGWYDSVTDELVSHEAFFAPSRPATGWPSSQSFRAKFAPESLTVILDANGGSAISFTKTVSFGSDVQLPDVSADGAFAMTRTGYTFAGWSISCDDNDTTYVVSDGGVVTGANAQRLANERLLTSGDPFGSLALKLYARWNENVASIIYSASNNGAISYRNKENSKHVEKVGAVSGLSTEDGNQIAAATAESSRGYHFVYWTYRDATGERRIADRTLTSASVQNAAQYSDTAGDVAIYHDTTFDAVFEPNTYIFSYRFSDGNDAAQIGSVNYASASQTNAAAKRVGYTFKGWNTSTDGSGITLAGGATISSTLLDDLIDKGALADSDGSILNLYGIWESLPTPVIPVTPEPAKDVVKPVPTIVEPEPFAPEPAVIEEKDEKPAELEVKEPTTNEPAGASAPVVISDAVSSYAEEKLGGIFGDMTAAEATRAASTTVTVVVTVGAVAGLVGAGASIAAASALGTTAAIGASATTSLSGIIDVAGDFAANAGVEVVGRAADKKKKRLFGGKGDQDETEAE